MLKDFKSGVAFATLSMLVAAAFSAPAQAQSKAKDLECKGCVGTKDLKKKAVKGSRLSNKAVTSKKIKDGTIGLNDLSGAVTAAIADPNLDPVTATVSCPGESIQAAVNAAVQGQQTTIFVTGTCTEDVVITTDDVTLSGNQAGSACNKASPGGTGTINGSVDILGVRANVEFLTITGSGYGIDIGNRATSHLTCNNISNNEAYGVAVFRASNAVLRDNTLNTNGTRETDPNIFFDCGLFVSDASAVRSDGNTYADNQYCAVSSSTQSSFKNGSFLPREPGHPADPDQRDVYIERGCDPATGTGCFTDDFGPVVIEAFNQGVVDLRNADLNGEIRPSVQSTFRVDGDAVIQGDIFNQLDSMVRIVNRFPSFGDRSVSFTGTLNCLDQSQVFFSSVDCGQTCTGLDAGGNLICAP